MAAKFMNSRLGVEEMLKAVNVESSEILVKEISSMLESLNYKDVIQPFIEKIEKNIDKLLPLTLSSRASNNPVNATLIDVEKILKNSLNYYRY